MAARVNHEVVGLDVAVAIIALVQRLDSQHGLHHVESRPVLADPVVLGNQGKQVPVG